VQQVYDDDLGLRANNFSIKPVHVANGLARALTGRSYKSTALQQTLKRYVENQTGGKVREERHSTADILERYPEAFASGHATDPQRVNVLRTLCGGLLNADSGVYDDPDKSSYTLSNERFVTRDPSDYRAGLFLARLVTAGGEGDAAVLIREYLRDESDPYTSLAMPMLHQADAREEAVAGNERQLAALEKIFELDAAGKLKSATLAEIRASFDRLARFERQQGSKLNALRRLVLFGCFAVHVHLVSRWAETTPGAPRPPILVDLFDGARLPLRDASRSTLIAAGESINGLVAARLHERFADFDDDAVLALLDEPRFGDPRPKDRKLKEVRPSYDALRRAGEEPGVALAEAYLQVGYEMDGGAPIGYLTELGRRAGYLTPWAPQGRGGKTLKRYGITAEFLETLVAATVESDEPVTVDQFLDMVCSRFGIVAGRVVDDQAIRRNNLLGEAWGSPTSIAEEDLRMNVEALTDALVETGYAKAYSDGQTVVTVNPDRTAGL
jgi:hypothetical protein